MVFGGDTTLRYSCIGSSFATMMSVYKQASGIQGDGSCGVMLARGSGHASGPTDYCDIFTEDPPMISRAFHSPVHPWEPELKVIRRREGYLSIREPFPPFVCIN
jgi:hypothetical protein